MWTKAAVAAHQRAKAVAEKHADALRRLAEMAKHAPAFEQRVKELSDMRDHLESMTAIALAVDPTGD